MTVDLYRMCPCGSGKKIKFCCSKELAHDIERVERMIQGDQRLAAIEKLDSLLAKHPDNPALLMLKVEVELALKELPKVQETIAKLQQVAPENPSVLALPIILDVVRGKSARAAVGDLQRAFSRANGVITSRLYEAVLLVAVRLLRENCPMAAKGHLQMALALSDAKDERCTSTLMELNHNRSIPLLMREPLEITDCPANVTWKIEFKQALEAVFRGRWLDAAEMLEAMSRRILDEPAILKNLAILRAWLGQNAEAVKAFRDYAKIRDVPQDDRVHAEALAQLLDQSGSGAAVDVVSLEFNVTDTEKLMEHCLSNRRMRQLPVNPEAVREGSPPPKAIFELLDRPMPEASAELRASDVPESLLTFVVYGRETDRDARIELALAKTNRYQEKLETLREETGRNLGDAMAESPLTRTSRLMAEVFGSYRLPDELSPEKRTELSKQLQQLAVTDRWTKTVSPLYGGLAPRDAAKKSEYKIPVLATLLILQLLSDEGTWGVDFQQLREDLGLERLPTIDTGSIDIRNLPVHRFTRLEIDQLSDEQLLDAYRRAYAVMAVAPLRQIALQIVSRESLDEKIDKVEAYDILSDVAVDTDEALRYLEKARKLATADGESPAQWLIDELEIRLLRGEIEKFTKLFTEIQTRYLKEPGIGPALLEVLSRYGLVTPDGRLMVPTRRDAAAATEQKQAESVPAGIWTPDGSRAPASEAGTTTASNDEGAADQKESKLWVPGMD